MFNKISKMLSQGHDEVVPVEIPAPIPVIGEPVISIVEAMKDVHQWVFRASSSSYSTSYFSYLTHISSGMSLKFYLHFVRIRCARTYEVTETKEEITVENLEWATAAEKEVLVEAFKKFREYYATLQSEYRAMELQIERDKFTEAFCKGKK